MSRASCFRNPCKTKEHLPKQHLFSTVDFLLLELLRLMSYSWSPALQIKEVCYFYPLPWRPQSPRPRVLGKPAGQGLLLRTWEGRGSIRALPMSNCLSRPEKGARENGTVVTGAHRLGYFWVTGSRP